MKQHVLYEAFDKDAPSSIRDSNGEVCLGMCKVCGRAEIQLDQQPECTPWFNMEEAPTHCPVIVWDDYWLMRIAIFDILEKVWRIDQPCVEEEKGLIIQPRLWQKCPNLPTDML